jgi:vacuolar protein sorting-associated protein VTA1
MKALREGRVPTPGPPGGIGKEEQDEDTTMSNFPPPISEFPSPPSNFTAPLPPSSPNNKQNDIPPPINTPPTVQPSRSNTIQPPPPVAPAPVQQVVVPQISVPEPATASNINVAAAQKNAKWAISALDYDDIKTARLQLLSALNEIGYNQDNNFGY